MKDKGKKEYRSPINAERSYFIVHETVVFTRSAERRLKEAEKLGVDSFLLKGIKDSLAATAIKMKDGTRQVTTDVQNFQFGILEEEIKGKKVHEGDLYLRPKYAE